MSIQGSTPHSYSGPFPEASAAAVTTCGPCSWPLPIPCWCEHPWGASTYALCTTSLAILRPLGGLLPTTFQIIQYHREGQTASPDPCRRPDPQEESFQEQEARAVEEVSPMANISSSSPDETIMPPPSFLADFKHFQHLIKRVAVSLQVPLKEVKEPHP